MPTSKRGANSHFPHANLTRGLSSDNLRRVVKLQWSLCMCVSNISFISEITGLSFLKETPQSINMLLFMNNRIALTAC